MVLKTRTWSTVALLSGSAISAYAQTGSEQRRGLQIEEVLVTAQKREEGANDIPPCQHDLHRCGPPGAGR
jgi:iron complex outermembrane receptor protein